MVNPNLRNYRIPTYADVPRTEVLLVETHDSVGPMKSKGIAESNVNPVAPALANALHDATGVRYRELPFTPERIYRRLERAQSHSRNLIGRHGHDRGHRHRSDGHHRPAACAPAAEQAFEAWQKEMNREAVEVPRVHRRRDQPADRGAARVGGRLPLRLDRPCAGVDQQRDPSGAPRRRCSSSSTGPAPSRSSAAARGRPIRW